MLHSKKRLIAAGCTLAAVFAGSALAATPAYAIDPLHGVVLDGGSPVADTDVYLLRYNPQSGRWDWTTSYLATTASDGTWSYGGSVTDSGKYALWYDVEDSRQAPYALSQGSNGVAAKDGSSYAGDSDVQRLALPTDFTVTSGVPSATSFSASLTHNAGAVTVSLIDGSGAAIADPGSSWGEVDLNNGYSASVGYLESTGQYVSGPDFTGTITVGHVAPGAYYGAEAEAGGYYDEPLDPIAVTAGATTTYGNATLQASGAPSVFDVATQPTTVTVSGVPKVGTVLTANVPTSTNGTPFTATYQWWSTNGPIAGATAATYVPTVGDIGDQLSVSVLLRQAGHVTAQIGTNDYTDPVVVGDPNQAVVTVTGTAKFGSTLKAGVTGGTVAGAQTAAYRWYRNGAPIAGADGSSYTLTKSDVGQKVFASITSFAQGHTDAVIPSNTVTVAKDAATVALKAKKSGSKVKITVTLKNGKSGATATGSVTVYYTAKKSKTVTFGAKTTSKTITVPSLKSGKITVKYLGSSTYVAKTYKVTRAK